MLDAIVVGAGLFGQIIARALINQGRKVVLIDRQEELAGSRPAACLMKPSWFSGLGKDVFNPSLRLLDDMYNVQEIEFLLRPRLAKTNVLWVDPREILSLVVINENVDHVEPGLVRIGEENHRAHLVVVAAGIWTEQLLKQYNQTGQMGAAFLYDHRDVQHEPPSISVWAPYRQLVRFDRGDGIWVGDGTAIKRENWTAERMELSLRRCQGAITAVEPRVRPRVLQGIRPYARGHKPCLLEEVSKGLWVASGGAKNGTIAAGYCAHTIRERTS